MSGVLNNVHGWFAQCRCGATSKPCPDKRDAIQVASDAGFVVSGGRYVTCPTCKEIQVQANRSRPRRGRR